MSKFESNKPTLPASGVCIGGLGKSYKFVRKLLALFLLQICKENETFCIYLSN